MAKNHLAGGTNFAEIVKTLQIDATSFHPSKLARGASAYNTSMHGQSILLPSLYSKDVCSAFPFLKSLERVVVATMTKASGDYRAGNMSKMSLATTFLAFIKNIKDLPMPLKELSITSGEAQRISAEIFSSHRKSPEI